MAIPALIGYRYYRNRVDTLVIDMEKEAIKLVEALHRKLRHDETTCTCETCSWIRNAEHLTEEAEHQLPHVDPPGVVHPE